MHNFQEIKDQAFSDAASIISRLGRVSTAEELVNSAEDISELSELVTFLQRFDSYALRLNKNAAEDSVNQSVSHDFISQEAVFEGNPYIAEEEVIFNNNFNLIDESEIDHPEMEDDVLEEEAAFNNELNEIGKVSDPVPQSNAEIDLNDAEPVTATSVHDSQTSEMMPEAARSSEDDKMDSENRSDEEQKADPISDEADTAEPANEIIEPVLDTAETAEPSETETDDRKPVESRRNIIDIEHEQKMQELNQVAEKLQEQHEEKKFKLSNIKGLKKIQSLFDDDPLEEVMREDHTPKPASDSLRKSNIPTDFMEAGKPKPEFKLDLNDKIAFSKMLFGGSQSRLNETIRELNSFATLEEAREYLSDAYYENNWEKSDEYAQRLWSLVESKFL
ncbi:hypothetical protein P0M11_04060 [Kaistella sp. PBT33-4]|uniref:hypothetical protein n=1 Tax=Kaistella sp. PBT33-4 TaxID=3032000 RepID=UPI0023D87A7E|nr:hypothetical protein [Kaistella sp. PBT33-4]MDF0719171.1 hypothetical protein [Kaistella sp. PBT33-4]